MPQRISIPAPAAVLSILFALAQWKWSVLSDHVFYPLFIIVAAVALYAIWDWLAKGLPERIPAPPPLWTLQTKAMMGGVVLLSLAIGIVLALRSGTESTSIQVSIAPFQPCSSLIGVASDLPISAGTPLGSIQAYETRTAGVKMFISNNSTSGAATAVVEKLELEILEVLPLPANLESQQYIVPCFPTPYLRGNVGYGSRIGTYPVTLFDGRNSESEVFLALKPGDVDGVEILVEAAEETSTGIYVMRFLATVRLATEVTVLHSDNIVRSAILPPTSTPNFAGDMSQIELINRIRERAYFKNKWYRAVSVHDWFAKIDKEL